MNNDIKSIVYITITIIIIAFILINESIAKQTKYKRYEYHEIGGYVIVFDKDNGTVEKINAFE